jgi:hypothetical protein
MPQAVVDTIVSRLELEARVGGYGQIDLDGRYTLKPDARR